ncbi:MAG TPA: GTP 3',8-cyclase MoaA [Chloroflexi bacterium]|nr:GTP 3',8-cyclase MoaA [Chloroflexota bacterium]
MKNDSLILLDQYSRPLSDLRISITDKCNFRCVYCMPKEIFGAGYQYLAKSDLLTYEEIVRLVSIMMNFGVTKVRITGGEPLLRNDVDVLISMLAKNSDLDLTLTTNGAFLTKDKSQSLMESGLKRITVSLDSLDDETFNKLNDVNFSVENVLKGISNASSVGFSPIKINMVVMRSVNLSSVVPMALYFKDKGHIVRFIEYMDVGDTNGWKLDEVVSSAEIISLIGDQAPLEPVQPNYAGEVAKRWKYLDGSGEIGVISSVTQPFCGNCSRLRLSAKGELFTCLFASSGHDISSLLRNQATDQDIADCIASIWKMRNDRYSELRNIKSHDLDRIEMSYIGG